MYSRDDVRAITDKVIDMAKADVVEVEFNGGERSATRFANSNITANTVQFDRSVAITVYLGNKAGSTTVRDFDDATLKQAVADALKRAGEAREAEVAPTLIGPQEYEPIDAALPSGVNYGPAERARAVRQSLDICAKKNVLGSGYIPKVFQTTCSRVLPVRGSGLHPHGADEGWRRLGLGRHYRGQEHEPDRPGAAHRDRSRQGAEESEAACARAGTLHGDPRAAGRRRT